jgi:O-antigen ligase
VLLLSVNITNSSLIWILLGGCAMLFFKPQYLIPVYLISSLSSNYFVLEDGMGISRIIGFILIISGGFYLIRTRPLIEKKNLKLLCLILLFCLISSLLFSFTNSLHSFLLTLQYFLIVAVFSQFKKVNLNILTKLIVISSFITILVLAFTLKDSILTTGTERLTTSGYVNANRFAMMLAQLSAVLISGVLIFKNITSRVFSSGFILLAFFMIILSGSRSAAFAVTLTIAIFILYSLKKSLFKMLIPLFFITIIVSFFLSKLESVNFTIIDRFSVNGIETSGGSLGRLEIWEKLIPKVLANNPLLGVGFGAENVFYLAEKNGLDNAAHNFIIDMFLQIGIFGVIVYFSYFIFIIKKIKTKLHNTMILLPIVLLLTALLNGVGETIFCEKPFWNAIALAWLYMNNITPKANQNQKIQNL